MSFFISGYKFIFEASVDSNNQQIAHQNSDGEVYKVYAFTQSGTLTVQNGGEAHVLVVGGGGTGDLSTNPDNGGGGAGGLIFKPNHTIDIGSYSIVVGDGAVGDRNDGGNSVFDNLTALGGGGGDDGSNGGAADGGSGGGGGSTGLQPSQPGDSGTFGYGNGSPSTSSQGLGVGGGGAGAPGTQGDGSNYGGDGGDGLYEVTQNGITYNFMKIFGGYGEVIDGESWFAGGGAGNGDNESGDAGPVSQQIGTGGRGGGGGFHNHHYTLEGGYEWHEQGDMDVIDGLPNTGGGCPGNDSNFITGSGTFAHRGGSGIVLIAVKGKPVSTLDGSAPEKAAPNAQYILDNIDSNAPSGLYWIRSSDSTYPPAQVYCDMSTDGGGWMHMATFTDRSSNSTGSSTTRYDVHPWGYGIGHFKNGRLNKRNWQNGYWGDLRPLGSQSFENDFKHTPGWFSIPFNQILMKDQGDSLRNLWYTNPGEINQAQRYNLLGDDSALSFHMLDDNFIDTSGEDDGIAWSQNNYPASNNDASFTTTRKFGSHAIDTMGDGTYIDIPGLPRFYAFSIWYYCVAGDNGYIVDFRHDNPSNGRGYLYTNSGGPDGADQNISLSNDTTANNNIGDIYVNGNKVTSDYGFFDGNWYHIVVSVTDTGQTRQDWDQGIRIGNRSDGSNRGNAGYFDNIRTFNRSLTAADVQTIYNAENTKYPSLQDFFNTGGKGKYTWEDGGSSRNNATRSLRTSITNFGNNDDVFGSADNILWAYGEAIDENPGNHDRSMITTGNSSESVSATQGIGVSRADENSDNYRNIDDVFRDEPGGIGNDYDYTMWIR